MKRFTKGSKKNVILNLSIEGRNVTFHLARAETDAAQARALRELAPAATRALLASPGRGRAPLSVRPENDLKFDAEEVESEGCRTASIQDNPRATQQ